MVKKVTTKTVTKTTHEEDKSKSTKKKDVFPRESSKKKMTAKEREDLLIENFVGLQHAMTNLSIKFGSLSDNISELLRVFENAAKSFAQSGTIDNSDMLRKIDSLLNQNKTIAKGLVLMESKLRGNLVEQEFPQPQPTTFERPRPRPLPSI